MPRMMGVRPPKPAKIDPATVASRKKVQRAGLALDALNAGLSLTGKDRLVKVTSNSQVFYLTEDAKAGLDSLSKSLFGPLLEDEFLAENALSPDAAMTRSLLEAACAYDEARVQVYSFPAVQVEVLESSHSQVLELFAATARLSSDLASAKLAVISAQASAAYSESLAQLLVQLNSQVADLSQGFADGLAGVQAAARAWEDSYQALHQTQLTAQALATAQASSSRLEAGADRVISVRASASVLSEHALSVSAAASEVVAQQKAIRRSL